jgi:hypothetical protein
LINAGASFPSYSGVDSVKEWAYTASRNIIERQASMDAGNALVSRINFNSVKSCRRGLFALAVAVLCLSCGESYSSSAIDGRLEDGRDGRTSALFSMNSRPVKIELYLRLSQGASAIVVIDHPDGRTTETLSITEPGIREVKKEFPKEPGSWGLRIEAKGGALSYWAALHDRKEFVGPDDETKRMVDRE